MEGVIEIHGEIGERVTLETVKAQINPDATSHTVYLSSEGGDVQTGIDIYHLLNKLPNVTVVVEGLAASIASVIMQAGKRIVAVRPSEIMIHNPFGAMQGESKDMLDAAKQLERVKSTIISVYKKRPKLSSLSPEAISQMMDKQTWMSADEAVAAGFIDEAVDKLKAVAKLDLKKIKMDPKDKPEASEEVKGLLQSFGAKLDKIFDSFKKLNISNAIELTLDSGAVMSIAANDGEDISGKTATIDGKPATAGPYTVAETGQVITIGENSVVASVAEKAADTSDKQLQEANNTISELKKQLAEKETVVKTTEKFAADALSQMKALKKEFMEFKNKIDNTAGGDPSTPPLKPRNQQDDDDDHNGYDPMVELGNAYLSSRNFN